MDVSTYKRGSVEAPLGSQLALPPYISSSQRFFEEARPEHTKGTIEVLYARYSFTMTYRLLHRFHRLSPNGHSKVVHAVKSHPAPPYFLDPPSDCLIRCQYAGNCMYRSRTLSVMVTFYFAARPLLAHYGTVRHAVWETGEVDLPKQGIKK